MPLTISWRSTSFAQESYSIRITDDCGKELFKEEKQTTDKKTALDLRQLAENRQTFFVQLSLHSMNNEQIRLLSRFTTLGNGIQKADWITRLDNPIAKEATYFRDTPTIILSKTVQLDSQIKNAWIDLCGLGYYTLFINGERVGKDYLNNDVSNYDKVVYYDTYEISNYLSAGENRISVELGNGWYNPAPIAILGKYNVRKQLSIGKPCLIASIDFENSEGTCWQLLTDNSWESSEGNIRMNNIFVGEKVTDKVCKKKKYNTIKIPGPTGVLTPGSIPKIQRIKDCLPKKITHLGNRAIIDFGEIISGQIAFTISKRFIGNLILNYSERLADEETLDFSSTISGVYGITDPELGIVPNQRIIQSDTVEKTQDTGFHYSNQYTYHSFRYVEIIFNESVKFEEVIEEFSAYRVHTNVDVIAEMNTSLPILNDLWQAGLQTRLNNIHSYFEDCTRERFGYGGDIVALIASHMYSIDGRQLLKKVMIDFINDQTIDGGIPATAPFVGIMTNSPSNKAGAIDWQLVLPTIANQLLEFYDETSFVHRYSSCFKRHIRYLLSYDFEYIKTCGLGDWGSIDEKSNGAVITSPDQEFCSACSYSLILQEYLSVMEKTSDFEAAAELSKKINEVNQKIIADYYRPEGYFGEGTQSSYVFAFKANLIEKEHQKEMINQLVKKIQANDDIVSVGIFGMSWIYELLHHFDCKDVLFNWLTRVESPSYQAMIAETGTLREHFPLADREATYNGSLNHAMFSSYSAWMVKQFLGIAFPEGYFNKVVITPQTDFFVEEIAGSIKTPYEKITLKWTQKQAVVTGEIILPKTIPYELRTSSNEWHIEKDYQDLGEQQKIILRVKEG
ncbi:hypothetical protein IGI39_001469 [Enterococcus sp. AZ135]|uniref:family 78 glycoside hydrolase catalytic domain n=1 Tax=unclassified Enterococcus TaxID=2608891 RepID=UPI003F1F3F05